MRKVKYYIVEQKEIDTMLDSIRMYSYSKQDSTDFGLFAPDLAVKSEFEVDDIPVRRYHINGVDQYVAMHPDLLEIFKLREKDFSLLKSEIVCLKDVVRSYRDGYFENIGIVNKVKNYNLFERIKFLFTGEIK